MGIARVFPYISYDRAELCVSERILTFLCGVPYNSGQKMHAINKKKGRAASAGPAQAGSLSIISAKGF